ncbi:MAG: methyltransferase domain-containing protein [bacterium]|nr:methyltransferase domain-containing protein [bacterium]
MDAFDEPLLEIEEPAGPPPTSPEKVYDFYATVVGGMEDVAITEIKRVLGKVSALRVVKGRRLSRIFFHYERSPKALMTLRSVAQVHVLLASISGVTVGPPGLLRIAQRVGHVDLVPAAVLHDILHGPGDEVGFRLSCTAGKGHRFSASELHQMVLTVLTLKYDVDEKTSRPYVLHLRLDGARALFGLQLITERKREREVYPDSVRGDVQPSVGYAIAELLRLRPQDRVLHIGCGGGQPLVEAGLAKMPGYLIGLDTSTQAVSGMRENAKRAGVAVAPLVGERGILPIATESVTKVIANLAPRNTVPPMPLFLFFSELLRVIRPDGQAFLIAEDRHIFTRMLDDFPGFKLLKRRPLHLQGQHLDLYILQRK